MNHDHGRKDNAVETNGNFTIFAGLSPAAVRNTSSFPV
jgi:hypothetical protein